MVRPNPKTWVFLVAAVVAQVTNARARDVDTRPAVILAKLNGQAGASVSFSDDGKKILTSGLKAARVWDGINFNPLTAPLTHGSGLVYAAFDPTSESVITTGADNVARLWSVRDGRQMSLFKHDGHVHFATFSPNSNTIITCGEDGLARLWNSKSGRLLLEMHHTEPVRYAVFLPNGDKVITSTGATRVWDAVSGKELLTRPDMGPNDNRGGRWMHPLTVSPDGTAAASTFTWLGVNWDPLTGKALFSVDTRVIGAWPDLVGYTPRGDLVTASAGLQIWERGQMDKVQTSIAPASGISDFTFTPDGKRVLIAAMDDSSGIWDVESGRQIQEFSGVRIGHRPGALFPAQREAPSIAMSRDGRRIAVGFESTDTTTVYELPAPQPSSAGK